MAKYKTTHPFGPWPKTDPAELPALIFTQYVEDYERGERERARLAAAYAGHADEYDAARRWWDRIIAEGRAGEFVKQRPIRPWSLPQGFHTEFEWYTMHITAYAGDLDLLHAPIQTLRKWWIRDGRPR